VCDAPFYRDKMTIVVGGGDAAIEDTLALTKFAKSVTMVVRRKELRASKIMQEKVLNNPKVQIWWESEVKEVMGEGRLERVRLLREGKEEMVMADGLFLAIGHKPATDVFKGQLVLDEKGYIVTRLGMEKASVELASGNLDEKGLLPYITMTCVPGVFAAGDVVDFRYKQAITAAGFGTMAALDAQWYLEREANNHK
jgi:thioredoxin reductase (NADPH)